LEGPYGTVVRLGREARRAHAGKPGDLRRAEALRRPRSRAAVISRAWR